MNKIFEFNKNFFGNGNFDLKVKNGDKNTYEEIVEYVGGKIEPLITTTGFLKVDAPEAYGYDSRYKSFLFQRTDKLASIYIRFFANIMDPYEIIEAIKNKQDIVEEFIKNNKVESYDEDDTWEKVTEFYPEFYGDDNNSQHLLSINVVLVVSTKRSLESYELSKSKKELAGILYDKRVDILDNYYHTFDLINLPVTINGIEIASDFYEAKKISDNITRALDTVDMEDYLTYRMVKNTEKVEKCFSDEDDYKNWIKQMQQFNIVDFFKKYWNDENKQPIIKKLVKEKMHRDEWLYF